MSRFFVSRENIFEDQITITDPEDLRHITKVLRLRPGDEIDVSDSAEFEYHVEILSLTSDVVSARILDKQAFAREPQLRVTLFQGVPKQGKMEEIIQKSTELGVHEICPVFTHRSVVTETKNTGKKTERWQRVASEAVKQCRRGLIPVVREPGHLKDLLEEFSRYDLVLFPYEDEQEKSIKEVLRSLPEKPETVAVFIGPEGGFSEEEAKQVIKAGGVSVSLGKTILRTETAGPAALAMIFYEWEL